MAGGAELKSYAAADGSRLFPREEEYKARQAIDTFFVRSGDMLAAGVVFAGTHLLGFGVAGFARTNVAVVLAAIAAAVLLLREYGRLVAPPAPASVSPAPAQALAVGKVTRG